MTVGRMMREMTMTELLEWRAFITVERSGRQTQETLDLDTQIKNVFAPMMKLKGNG